MIFSLEQLHSALIASNGNIAKAAKALGMPSHALKTKVDKHAELQAITRNRDQEIADKATDVIYNVLHDPLVDDVDKLATAKWAVEHLRSEVYTKRTDITINDKPARNMTEDELKERLAQIDKEILSRHNEQSGNGSTGA